MRDILSKSNSLWAILAPLVRMRPGPMDGVAFKGASSPRPEYFPTPLINEDVEN